MSSTEAAPSPQLGDRVDRAFEPMVVEEIAPEMYEVTTLSGESYRVDPRLGCQCEDFEYRMGEQGGKCKHQLRVVYEEGPDVLEVEG